MHTDCLAFSDILAFARLNPLGVGLLRPPDGVHYRGDEHARRIR
jgi:hypothetical protein